MGAVWSIWTLLQPAGMLSKTFWNFKSMQMVRMLIKANQAEAVLNVKREKVLPLVLMEIKAEVVIRILLNSHNAGKFKFLLIILFFRNANEVYRMSKASGYSGLTSHNS